MTPKNKELKDLTYKLEDKMLTTEVTFVDDTKVYIFIQNGMIFISDCDYTELSNRIGNDDTESFESYDTTDGCDYYMNSKYYEYVNCSLLYLTHRFL